MNLESDLRAVLGELIDDEPAIITELKEKPGSAGSENIPRRICRGEFVAELVKRLCLEGLVTTISLHNLNIKTALNANSLQAEKPYRLLAYDQIILSVSTKVLSTNLISQTAKSHHSKPAAFISSEILFSKEPGLAKP